MNLKTLIHNFVYCFYRFQIHERRTHEKGEKIRGKDCALRKVNIEMLLAMFSGPCDGDFPSC